MLGLVDGADLMIYDATYTDAEYPQPQGLGAFDLAGGHAPRRCGGRAHLVIFHHDPGHDDSVHGPGRRRGRRARGPGRSSPSEGLVLRP